MTMMRRAWTLLVLLFLYINVKAQVPDNTMHLDTLSLTNRVSIKTNGMDWLMLVPNIGLEFDVKNKNWSRWAIGVSGRYNWRTTHTYKQPFIWDVMGGKLEVRNYWRTRKIDGRAVKAHEHWYDRLFSQRRYAQRHPLTTYYRSYFLSYDEYAYRFSIKEDGRRGKNVMLGMSYGIVRPIYKFSDGSSIDVEVGASVGWGMQSYSKFSYNREFNAYPITHSHSGWTLMHYPMVQELRAGFVYRIGRKSVYEKHRYRYDVDALYRAKVDSMVDANAHKMYIDSINSDQYRRVYDFFQQQIDSLQKTMPMTKETKKQQRLFRPLNAKKGGQK